MHLLQRIRDYIQALISQWNEDKKLANIYHKEKDIELIERLYEQLPIEDQEEVDQFIHKLLEKDERKKNGAKR